MIASTPTNQAERPDVVTRDAVSVANSIIATAPGQKFKSIGAGIVAAFKDDVAKQTQTIAVTAMNLSRIMSV